MRFSLIFAMLIVVAITQQASAQVDPSPGDTNTAVSSTRHTVGSGDTLYGIVAEHYPQKMARWTDVAAEIVELNPGSFPQGLDTVMRLGDELILPAGSRSETASSKTDELSKTVSGTLNRGVNQNTTSEVSGAKAIDSTSEHATTSPPTPSETPANEGLTNNTQEAIEPNTDSQAAASGPQNLQKVIGEILALTGRAVAIDQSNRQRTLTTNDAVHQGDAISTDENSNVTVRMIDNAEVELQAASRLMFEHYQYDKNSHQGSAVMTQIKGAFRMTSGLLGKHQPGAMTVNTAVATLGVRNALFASRVCAGENCRINNSGRSLEPGLYTGVIEGTVVVSNNTGNATSKRGEFLHTAAPNTIPEPALNAAPLLFTEDQLALLDIAVEEEKPLSFFGWLKHKIFGD